jgi:hypothetical protein
MVMFRGLNFSFKKINKSKARAQVDQYVIKTADDLLNTKNNLASIKIIKSLI